jgi:demethoxyubiquinone hydroxylase (CLK1/Coq7/Cat5 family)
MRRVAAALVCGSFALALAACGGGGTGQAQSLADSTTKAVYNDDPDNVTAHFDDQLKSQVTRTQVAIISDKMHKQGDYQGLSFMSSDPNKNEYTYKANFSKGSLNVVMRLDQNGEIAAYRVLAPATQ